MARRDLEVHLEEKCVNYSLAFDCDNVKLDLAKKDYPDRLFFLPNGRTMLVEFKRPGEKPRTRQSVIHHRLSTLRHPVSVVADFQVFQDLLSLNLALPRVPASTR